MLAWLALLTLVGVHCEVLPGAMVLRQEGWARLQGRRVGICSNPTGILSDTLEHIVDAIHASNVSASLVAVFGPEHGFRGDQQAGKSDDFYIDPDTSLPVFSLYSKSVAQAQAIFRNASVDLVVYDIQEVGTRFYTFIWTLWLILRAAALDGIEVMVLDRPNPLGGVQVLGPVLQPGFESGVGQLPIALAHGMTIGELGNMFANHFLPNATRGGVRDGFAFSVVKMSGWVRGMVYEQTNLPWVMPSPNMPTVDTARLYPGFGMLEGTNLTEGRGTTRPFEIVGGPFFVNNSAKLIANVKAVLQQRSPDYLKCSRLREQFFVPTFSKYTNVLVGGVQVYPANIDGVCEFDPVFTALVFIIEAKRLSAGQFGWLEGNFIDLLSGSDAVRKGIDAGKSAADLIASWQGDVTTFLALRKQYMLY